MLVRANEWICIPICGAICSNESFDVDVARDWLYGWSIKCDLLVVLMQCPCEEWSIYSSITDAYDVEGVLCKSLPVTVELLHESQDIFCVGTIAVDEIHISFGIGKTNTCRIVNQEDARISAPGVVNGDQSWVESSANDKRSDAHKTHCKRSNARTSIEEDEHWVILWFMERFDKQIMQVLVPADV